MVLNLCHSSPAANKFGSVGRIAISIQFQIRFNFKLDSISNSTRSQYQSANSHPPIHSFHSFRPYFLSSTHTHTNNHHQHAPHQPTPPLPHPHPHPPPSPLRPSQTTTTTTTPPAPPRPLAPLPPPRHQPDQPPPPPPAHQRPPRRLLHRRRRRRSGHLLPAGAVPERGADGLLRRGRRGVFGTFCRVLRARYLFSFSFGGLGLLWWVGSKIKERKKPPPQGKKEHQTDLKKPQPN